MNNKIFAFLDELSIPYEHITHPAVYTSEEARRLVPQRPARSWVTAGMVSRPPAAAARRAAHLQVTLVRVAHFEPEVAGPGDGIHLGPLHGVDQALGGA